MSQALEVQLLPYNRYRGRVGRAPLRSARALDPRRITGLEAYGVGAVPGPPCPPGWRVQKDRRGYYCSPLGLPWNRLPKWMRPKIRLPRDHVEPARPLSAPPWRQPISPPPLRRPPRLVSPPRYDGVERSLGVPPQLIGDDGRIMPRLVSPPYDLRERARRLQEEAERVAPPRKLGMPPQYIDMPRLVSPPPGVRGVGAAAVDWEQQALDAARRNEDAQNAAVAQEEASRQAAIDPVFGTVFDSLIREAGLTARQMLGRGEISEEDYLRAERLADIVRRGQTSAFDSPLVILGVVGVVGLVAYLATRRRR